MREFSCPQCRETAVFEQLECTNCRTGFVFEPATCDLARREGHDACANRDVIGCNWAADPASGLCLSCRLTRTTPALDVGRNLVLWRRVEEAKRWLIYDLLRLQLPFATRDGTPLLFDILSEHGGAPVMTGHLNGIVTLNLAEADDVEREMRRIHFCEPYRTLLGHFRHEVGHFYWQVLVGDTDLKGPFKLIFGDEAEDYAAALASYYDKVSGTRDFGGFITEYASAHPWEDWAETFAHFLHIVSTLDSLAGLPLAVESRSRQTFENPYLEADFDELLASWKAVARSINKLNRSLGLRDAYPFDLSQAAIGKLHFIHLAVQGLRRIRARAGLSDAAEA